VSQPARRHRGRGEQDAAGAGPGPRGGSVSSVSDTTLRGAQPAQPQAKPGAVAAFFNGRLGRWLTALGSVGAGVAVWQLLSMRLNPLFLPSPSLTLAGAVEFWGDGALLQSGGAALSRRPSGVWRRLVLGGLVGRLLGVFVLL